MNEKNSINRNRIYINGTETSFDYDIRNAVEAEDKIYVLLSIPQNSDMVDNIFPIKEKYYGNHKV